MSRDLDLGGPLPTPHPRQEPVELARRELASWLDEWRKRCGLTWSEYVLLVSEQLVDVTRLFVRSERNPNPED